MSKRLRQEDGIALVMALSITVVLIIFVSSMIGYTSSNSRNANVSRSRVSAHALAEGALSAAASILNAAPDAASPTALGCSADPANINNSAPPCTDIAVAVPGGTAYLHGLYTQGQNATGAWTISAYGSVRNPASGASLIKTMTATMTITGGGQSNNISVWNYIYSTAPQAPGCEVDLNGDHVQVKVPVYVTGDLCLSGDHAQIIEDKKNGGQAVDVRVQGTVNYLRSGKKHDATVGVHDNPITSGWAGGGCITEANPVAHPCTTADDWWVSQTDTPLTATPPVTDFPGWYTNASPGPGHLCDPVLTPSPNLTAAGNKFDNDVLMNATNTVFDITPKSTDYNCVTSSGKLSWNHSTQILTISGTIFFDGDVTATADHARYHGKATVYINGALILNKDNSSIRAGCPASPAAATRECGWGDSAKDWDPNSDMLAFISNKPSGIAVDMTNDKSEFQGDIMCTQGSTAALAGDHTKFEGGLICGKFTWGDHTQIIPMPTITNLPPGAPVPPNAPATIGTPVVTGA